LPPSASDLLTIEEDGGKKARATESASSPDPRAVDATSSGCDELWMQARCAIYAGDLPKDDSIEARVVHDLIRLLEEKAQSFISLNGISPSAIDQESASPTDMREREDRRVNLTGEIDNASPNLCLQTASNWMRIVGGNSSYLPPSCYSRMEFFVSNSRKYGASFRTLLFFENYSIWHVFVE
jgi:hypothetical protein